MGWNVISGLTFHMGFFKRLIVKLKLFYIPHWLRKFRLFYYRFHNLYRKPVYKSGNLKVFQIFTRLIRDSR